ncbi:family 10 glycosylhydrolase [Gillisia sp. M10.2A]|uniref:Family 10 glycosylhydrolase n=1 Tax=Gillisia lutea TaxID=2909668 RepID=A0ABS9ECK1_9FLAO|nr:family 10 glycosylhydrolase [Gillisia lutea]MCF4100610.1 family 10 glycosylhydrolase [Gillisia lutea]
MSLKIKSILVLMLCALTFNSCKTAKPSVEEKPVSPKEVEVEVESPKEEEKPVPEEKEFKENAPLKIEEFRAAWVATVANINWPSKSGLPVAEQQKEAIKLLDYLEAHNFNAVIFQVRPQADALYNSDLEPWSHFLTGKQGTAPNPLYDPLEFWTEAAHKRGLELHVWLNPYRAYHTTGGEISEQSIIKTHPELAFKLKNGMWWLDPSQKGTQDHTSEVVMDIVKRYDIDGVHFDDYFYPYASYNNNEDFPDAKSYSAYTSKGGKLSKGDWRRESVNTFIERIYKEIKAEKPFVKFGLSPFGIWRPGYPESISGMDQYSELYADAKLWLNKGWVDYFTPQLYWKINQLNQSFPVLLGWWESENTKNRHLWPGINVGLGGDDQNTDETLNQIMITRGMLPESKGTIHWSIGPLVNNPNLSKALLEGPYKKKALVPASPWLSKEQPTPPVVGSSVFGERLRIAWTHVNTDEISKWVLYFKYADGAWDYKILNASQMSLELQYVVGEKKKKLSKIGVTAVDRNGVQSEFKEIILK